MNQIEQVKATDHPAYPFVVYGQTGPAPEPTSESEHIIRKLKLESSAMRQAIALVNYEEAKAKFPPGEPCIIPIPATRTSPPIICVNGEFYRYSKEEWEDAVARAMYIYKRANQI
jgi:hypothetical protein